MQDRDDGRVGLALATDYGNSETGVKSKAAVRHRVLALAKIAAGRAEIVQTPVDFNVPGINLFTAPARGATN
jgi:hypothetical protein